MAKTEKKGGFFSMFRKSAASGNEGAGLQPQASPAAPATSRAIPPEARGASVSSVIGKAADVAKPVAAPAQVDSAIDTVEAFKVLCQSLADIGVSQLKAAEMVLNVLSNSLNKIARGAKQEK